MTTPTELLSKVTSTVGYLRINAPVEGEPLSCARLATDGDYLTSVVRSTAAGRGTERDDVALSLFIQAYAFRIASAAVGSWLMSNGAHTFDVRPANTSIVLGRHRPNALVMNHVKFSPDTVQSVLFDQHLIPLIETAHEAFSDPTGHRVGKAMLLGNLGAGVASAFGAFHGNADGSAERANIREAAAKFRADSPDKIRDTGYFVTHKGEAPEPGWFWERASCCLLYLVPPTTPDGEPIKCEDCSLWSDADRIARYRAATGTTK